MDVDRIAETFKDQILFMTGATGFMGKVFLERLLRVTEVRKIFILVRPKRNKNPEERLIEIFANPLFDKLKSKMSIEEILTKVETIAGDCSYKDLNLSSADRTKIVQNATMIFHVAATVKFNEKFKRAIELNVRGTREMIKLALECQNLQVFCHVSTAYSHLEEKVLMDKYYEAAADPHEIIAITEKFSEDEVEEMLSSYLCDNVPNTYVFTKGLSETLVARAHEEFKLPVMITRPAIIMSAYHEPIAGWTDNLYNITGCVAAGGAGVLRTFLAAKDAQLNITCVDYVVGNVMMSTWNFLTEKSSSLYVVNLDYMSVSLRKEFVKGVHVFRDFPLDFVMWYPNLQITDNIFIFYFNMILFQWIPSLFLDMLLILCGKKPALVKAQKKIFLETKLVRSFHDNKWIFDQTRTKKIYELLNEIEIKNYGTENRDNKHFHTNNCMGMRRYVFKQKDENLENARFKLKIIYIIDRIAKGFFFYWIAKIMFSIFQ